ncbi:MAG: hypothetical protein ACI8Z1_001438 [Candidatus Azotimanducaceae bacterium]|jgi:hypothetical protein
MAVLFLGRVLVNRAVFHHKSYIFKEYYVVQWVTGNRNHIDRLTPLQCSEPGFLTHQGGVINRAGTALL